MFMKTLWVGGITMQIHFTIVKFLHFLLLLLFYPPHFSSLSLHQNACVWAWHNGVTNRKALQQPQKHAVFSWSAIAMFRGKWLFWGWIVTLFLQWSHLFSWAMILNTHASIYANNIVTCHRDLYLINHSFSRVLYCNSSHLFQLVTLA